MSLDLSKDKIYEGIYEGLLLNANTLKCSECYIKCANKYKLPVLLKAENQVVMGRRGTGKTTIFKAFTYYVNKIYNNEKYRAWYVSIDECLPNQIELKSDAIDDIVVYSLKNFLIKLLEFLYHDFEKMETRNYPIVMRTNIVEKNISALEDKILELAGLVVEGSPETETYHKKVTQRNERRGGLGIRTHLQRKGFFPTVHGEKSSTNEFKVETEKEYLYKLKIDDIRHKILEIFELFGYEKVYFCIDEFNLIDRRTLVSIQARFGQALKQLFFGSNLIVIKIANVWNESKMQERTLGGAREGIEMDQDIFQRHELNLDTMFEHKNEQANIFFKDMLVNDMIYQQTKTENLEKGEKYNSCEERAKITKEERELAQEKIVETLFQKNAFEHLVCGSMGIPRIFGTILVDCLGTLKRNNSEDKISVSFVCDGIIDHYNKKVRQGIPYTSPICCCIDDYVTDNKQRFFLVKMKDYNKGNHYFDGLVAKNALHQCPSEQLPRKIKNNYKAYYVHYGNYLESVKGNSMKLINHDLNNAQLYPEFPKDLLENVEQFVLSIPEDAYDEVYCTKCHQYYKRTDCKQEKYAIFCPQCNDVITNWK